jgi:hypothetical protein
MNRKKMTKNGRKLKKGILYTWVVRNFLGLDHRWQHYRQDIFPNLEHLVIIIHVKLQVILSSSLYYTAV